MSFNHSQIYKKWMIVIKEMEPTEPETFVGPAKGRPRSYFIGVVCSRLMRYVN